MYCNPPGKRRTGWSTDKSDPSKLNDCYKNALQTAVDLELNSVKGLRQSLSRQSSSGIRASRTVHGDHVHYLTEANLDNKFQNPCKLPLLALELEMRGHFSRILQLK